MKNVKTLIAYASKTGTARSCTERLAAYFPDCVLADLMQTSPNPAAYDIVIIGGGVRFGSLHKAASKYIQTNQSMLRQKRTAYFLCSFDTDAAGILRRSIPADLISAAVVCASLGGELDMRLQKGIDRLVAGAVSRAIQAGKMTAPPVSPEAIARFARSVLNA